MTIAELLAREDLYGIIERTLPGYYREVFNLDVNVKLTRKHVGDCLLVFPRLGVIISKFPSKKVKHEIYSQFDVQNNIIKKIIAKVYIFLCIHSFGVLADCGLFLSQKKLIDRDSLIIPGNRKIRFLYFREGFVDSIIKSGFSSFYFDNEVLVRERLCYSFIPKILDSNQNWYREKLLIGKGLVREPSSSYNIYLDELLSDLKQLYHDSLQFADSKSYCLQLVEWNCKIINSLEEKKKLSCGEYLLNIIAKMERIIQCSDSMNVPIVFSHGDLQTGNVHIEEETGNLYIIDWETGGNRSIWYDSTTVLCTTRRKGKFSQMTNNRFNSDYKSKILYFDKNKTRDIDVVIAILVLEEMQFFVTEIDELPGNIGIEIIDRFIFEMNSINWNSFVAISELK